ncbi:nickel ABC transporter, periplasmic nickel- binding protein [Desulfofarcimen acetoxidans DSM 771]|uniref:Nickel ABC transporter, periplasmic nickel-binding protein n=1 Tax=Desulfofarcimen acetoxidans (strain ATCC 49208 / DSM 771 / KCTC 5769 / VKM B-1644 / 5575) TaxID=485916 RepID=C8W4V2_DESAS|nr:nickel ABC transporter substrate-binding protein [Desulfofarcimen acetoxidans]ACV61304.1 nickel ABC transporter, periplasmic nickel- binding protein [Desulfofarcimen acetoxidans DSM 771]
MKKLIYLALLLIIVYSVSLTGCGNSTEKTTGVKTKAKELTFSWNKDIGDLNPHNYSAQMFAQGLVYEPLVTYAEGGKIEPCLAEKWDTSPDGREITFTLRKGVNFSDGTEFNAAAAKQNFDAVLANAQRHEWLELINQIEKTEVSGDYTLKVYFKNAYYPALQEFALIRPIRFLAPTGFPENGQTSEAIKKPIGTGPWVLSEYKKDEYAVFTRNENYWGTKPKLEKVIVKIIPDGETRVIAFEKGELDLIFGSGVISLDSFKQLKESGKYETKNSGPLSTRVIAMNSNKGATKDLPVRQAIQHGINKQAVINGIFYGTEEKADTLFSSNLPYCDLKLKPYDYNLEKAASLLDNAGWKQADGKEFREKNGQALELELCFDSTDNIQKSAAEAMQGDLKKLGINLKLIAEESQAYNQRQKDGNFNLIFSETWGVPYDPHSLCSSMRKPSHADYQAQSGLSMKPEIDKKIEEVLLSTDEKTRQELYTYILKTLHEQAVYLPISYRTNMAVYHKNLSGFKFLSTQYDVPLTDIDIK